jgi:hypothetical protein
MESEADVVRREPDFQHDRGSQGRTLSAAVKPRFRATDSN